MISHSIWIVGASRSGKTTRLVESFCDWLSGENLSFGSFYTKKQSNKKSKGTSQVLHLPKTEPGFLVLAANSENRRELADKIVTATQGKYPVRAKTILGFFQDEVILFWPLLIQSLHLKAQFPLRLRPETEQELAAKLWHSQLNTATFRRAGVNEYRLVRRILDLLQLAAYSGTRCEDIAKILHTGLQENAMDLDPEFLASLLLDWRDWCLQRGLLTYGIITELYSQKLLSDRYYQQHLTQRYQAVLADDVDDYPGVARQLFDFLLDQGAVGAFSYNPDGAVRLGLGGDPNYLKNLSGRCQIETLTNSPSPGLMEQLATPMLELVSEQIILSTLPEAVQLIQTKSRAELLRATAEEIIQAVKSGKVKTEEVAIIAPGLDALARYTLIEILGKQNILVESLNDQRPLISSPVIRALLTMLALVYPGLGRLVDREAVAEMLVVLSRKPEVLYSSSALPTRIDPVRAGLIVDYCFAPHPDYPNLLPVRAFERWDRIGYAATTAYDEILQWLEKQRGQQAQRLIPSPISLLYLAIQDFLCRHSNPPHDQMAALRELLETAQHYWEIDARLRQTTPRTGEGELNTTLAEFIRLLRLGTITANPYPLRPIGPARKAVTLATIFQYRSSRRFHRWHFWLDVGSPLWTKGGAATLFGAPLFLRDRLGQPWTAEDDNSLGEERLRRILADLLSRVAEKVYLCHSELAVNGQEQLGRLLPLVHACL
ncbi:PD-(D/E)XK nuclease family protein [Umezakia ovalisporum]|uniref:Recombinase family protein n=1 Tax=Umezakia ovalisporum FSS-43 TaxID=2740520 RepID=A0ABT6K2F9_9CYAN|nr:recombinase family protein [Umezakia ovalisporum]MDH6056493.1 recombinase family protein [Umezakia ovalisporum FSS-43]MDH6068303.1 recombinase family protein [Umezakia ovalisporum APH033B]MDH6069221.1 recombinase family protein [Umezakia ovalisporum CobakiLakeA]MDH6079110.1 recombinase family protein [Umezakia ovalisporum FSS-45]MDH6080969.1 recombinase family protein [Umezakia ovalisporum FSS-44]